MRTLLCIAASVRFLPHLGPECRTAPALARLLSGETSRAMLLRDLKPKSQSALSQRVSVVVPMPMVVIVPVVVIQAAVDGELF